MGDRSVACPQRPHDPTSGDHDHSSRLPRRSEWRSPDGDNGGAPRATRLRVQADARPGARVARRGRGVLARPRPADADGRLGAAQPLRRLPRGAVRTREPGLRPVAADEVPLVRRARRARLRHPQHSPREESARDARGCAPARPALPRRARTAGGRSAARPSRGGGASEARAPRVEPGLRREDAPAVAALHLSVNPDQLETPERVWYWNSRGLKREQWRQWVAEGDGEIVGSAWANFEWSVPTPGKGRFWIAVAPDSRGCGIGSGLYEQVEQA